MTTPPRAFGTRPVIKLRGNRLPEQVEPNLTEVIVETDLTAPGSCLLTFADPGRDILDTLDVEFLQSLEVLASAVEETQPRPIFIGEVYGFDFEADETGTFALIRAYDAAYKLKQRHAITTFNDVTDGDVVRELARDAGVEVDSIDGGNVVHPYLAQVNQSHWDFLQERARANDRVLQVRTGRLGFAKSTDASSGPVPGDYSGTDPLQLTAGHNLLYLRVRTTAAQQVESVEVRGWDPARKEAVVAAAGADARSARLKDNAARVGARYGARTRVAAFPALTTQASCEVAASSVAERVAGSFGYAEGEAIGDPRLSAGVAVSVGRTGRFDGRYTLTSARHVFDRRGYHTSFRVSGGHDRTMYGLSGRRCEADGQRFDGVYPAVVTNLDDPRALGRVKVKLPWLADDYESDWARVMQIGAGPDRGILWFPEVGDEVVVSFLAGHPSTPMVMGGLFNGTDAPPLEGFADAHDGHVDTRCLKTRIGHALVFEDRAGEESVRIETGDGAISVTLDQANGALVIQSAGDVVLKAGGDLRLEAGGKVTVSGSAISLN